MGLQEEHGGRHQQGGGEEGGGGGGEAEEGREGELKEEQDFETRSSDLKATMFIFTLITMTIFCR